MRLRNNPWLITALGILSLAAYAYFESILEMVVFGLPFFCVVLGAVWLQRVPAFTAPQPRKGERPGPKWPVLVFGAFIVLGFAYIAYGRFTDSGLVGWLDSVQSRRSGRYSERLSFITALMDLLVVLGLGGACAAGWQHLRRKTASPGPGAGGAQPASVWVRPDPRSSEPAAALRAQRKLTLAVFAGLFVAIWALGYPVYLWTSSQHREDLAAQYEPIRLSAHGANPSPREGHVALFGVPKYDEAVTLRRGRSDRRKYYLPVAAPGGSASDEVAYVVEFETSRPSRLEVPILARVDGGALPATIVDAFERDGVHVDPHARLLSLVPSRGGKVEDGAQADLELFLGTAGMSSGLLVLMAPVVWLLLARKLSRLEAAARRRVASPA